MIFGNIDGLIDGTERIVFDYEVSGSGVPSVSTGNILNGNEDGWYTIIYRTPDSDTAPAIRINGISSADYGHRWISAYGSTVSDISDTGRTSMYVAIGTDTYSDLIVAKLHAKSGSIRKLFALSSGAVVGTSVGNICVASAIWNNTADNITSLHFIDRGGTVNVGTRIIILKSNNFLDGMPSGEITTPYIKKSWVRVGSQILDSASTSVTFSNLDGDRDVIYLINASIKSGANSSTVALKINNDSTTGHYGHQRLTASDTTVAAAKDPNVSFIYLTSTAMNTNEVSTANAIIYAKQGYARHAMVDILDRISGATITKTCVSGNSFSVTNTNITSMSIYSDQTNGLAAGTQINIYALRPNG